MRTAAAFAVLAIVPLLAGCTDGDAAPPVVPPVSPGLPAAALTEGGTYAFAHAGGPLVFTLAGNGDAAFELYDGEDRRLGSVGFSSETTRTSLHRVDGVPRGDVVLRLQTLNGTLLVESDGQPVLRFMPLGLLVERIVLVSTAPGPLDVVGIGSPVGGTGEPVDEQVPISLRRAPSSLRLLAAGAWSGLDVEVRSERGVVLRLDVADSSSTPIASPGRILLPLRAEATPQNLRDGELVAHVRADDLRGALVLEAESYSRAPLPTPGQDAGQAATFSYGELPAEPVVFTVHQDATRLLLWQEAGNGTNASVALFDAHDRRVANVVVPREGVVAVPVSEPGDYVAVRLAGSVSLGADRAPADFDLRPLEVQQTIVPGQPAGNGGLYAIATEELDLPTAFAFDPAVLAVPQGNVDGGLGPNLGMFGCSGGRFLRVDQGGEAVLVSLEPVGNEEFDARPFVAGALALGAGALTVTHDGFGDDGCERPAVAIRSYLRSV